MSKKRRRPPAEVNVEVYQDPLLPQVPIVTIVADQPVVVYNQGVLHDLPAAQPLVLVSRPQADKSVTDADMGALMVRLQEELEATGAVVQ